MIIQHLPIDIPPRESSSFSVAEPGQLATKMEGGPTIVRSFGDYPVRSYGWSLVRFKATTTQLARLSQMLAHLRVRGHQFALRETVSERHGLLVSPEVCDGSRTTWALPVESPSDVSVFVGGALQQSGYTLHAAANLIADDDTAYALEGAGDVTALDGSTAVARSLDVSAVGLASHKVTYPGGAAASKGIQVLRTATAIPKTLVAGSDYTMLWFVLGTGTFALTVQWANVSGNVGSPVDSSGVTGSLAGWTEVSLTGTVPATADRCTVSLKRTESTALAWYATCLAITPGDYPHWHAPSCCPAVVEFAAAPAADVRMTGRGTGKHLGLCRLDSSSLQWRRVKPGAVLPVQLAATQEHPTEIG